MCSRVNVSMIQRVYCVCVSESVCCLSVNNLACINVYMSECQQFEYKDVTTEIKSGEKREAW